MALKILICDDAGFVREILTQALHELGHHVIGEARDGNEAVAQAVKLRPDVILMDLVLPLKNGAEATKDIKAHFDDIRIVAISTVDEKFLAQKAQEIGCDAYMAKPFSKLQLKAVLEQFQTSSSREVRNG